MTRWRTFIDPSVGDGQNTINGIIADGSAFGVGISDDLNVTGLSTFSDIARFSSAIRLDGQLRDGDNNFGSSGQVLSSDGTDTRWINAGSLSAGAASQVAINDDSNTNAERFITLVDSSSGNNNVKTDASLKYNPSTNTITTVNITGNVTGNLTGNASSASVLQTTRTIGGVSFNGSANINLPGVNQTGNQNTSGNAGSATVLETTRNFSISGEITANAQSFNGSGNVTLSATVDDNVIDEANLKISNSPTNGRFLQCNTGVSGGLTWAEVTLPTSNTLSGSTLASGITASSITSLGTLTGLTVSGVTQLVKGTSGGASSNTDAALILDNSSNIYIQFRSPATREQGLLFGDNADNDSGNIIYDHSDNALTIATNGGTNERLRVNATGLSVTGSISASNGFSGNLTGNVSGTSGGFTAGNASNLNSGTIPDARLANSSLFVTGMIMMYTGSTAPDGWAICNGQNGTPDLRDRFIVGAGSAYSVNNTGGNDAQTLSLNQIPSHSHTINNHTHSFSGNTGHFNTSHTHGFSGSNTHNHSFTGVYGNDHNDSQRRAVVMRNDRSTGYFTAAGGSGVQNATITISGDTGGPSANSNHQHSFSGTTGNPSNTGTNSQGGGQSVDIRPKYYALMFIMKL